jgi:hypothetical protein
MYTVYCTVYSKIHLVGGFFVFLYIAQNRQRARRFVQSSKFGLPHPLTRPPESVKPPSFALGGGGGGAHSLAVEGMGKSQFGRLEKSLALRLIGGTAKPSNKVACFYQVGGVGTLRGLGGGT